MGTRLMKVFNIAFLAFDYQHQLLPEDAVRTALGLQAGETEMHQ